jgi:signal transduction histidine kinase
MELARTRRWFYGLTLLWVLMILGLGSWWLYLVFKLHNTLSELNIPELGYQGRFLNMMKWEGSFFFIFLVLLGGSLFMMYFRDMRKTKAMQAFFSSLSHELKTPLASMRLQAEVINDLVGDEVESQHQLKDLTKRLIEDAVKLEAELEKSLQLSRIEQQGSLSLVPVSLDRFLKKHQQKSSSLFQINIDIKEDAGEILADELALSVIFRNLFENTQRHNPESRAIDITVKRHGPFVELTYDDLGRKFKGKVERLGDLFYKFNSTKGSGIGLYLIKNLMIKMEGTFQIINTDRLIFKLTFKSPEGSHD